MHQIFKLSIIAVGLILSSCTSYLLPDTQDVVFLTDSDSSKVRSVEKEFGTGKKISTTIDRTGFQQIVIQTPGFKDEHYLLAPEKRDPLFYPVAILDLPILFVYGESLINLPNGFLYPNEIKLSNRLVYPKRNIDQRYVNIEDVKIAIADYDQDIQTYFVPNAPNIEGKLLEEKKLRISENLEAKRLEEQRLAELSKKKRNRMVSGASLSGPNDRKSLFAENTVFTDDLFNVLYQSGFIDTVNRIFQDNNNTIFLEAKMTEIDEFIV